MGSLFIFTMNLHNVWLSESLCLAICLKEITTLYIWEPYVCAILGTVSCPYVLYLRLVTLRLRFLHLAIATPPPTRLAKFSEYSNLFITAW